MQSSSRRKSSSAIDALQTAATANFFLPLFGDFGNKRRRLVFSPNGGRNERASGEFAFVSLQLRITLATIGLALMISVYVSAARAPKKVRTNDQIQIVDRVNSMFIAMQTDDAAKLTCAALRKESRMGCFARHGWG